jgi:hypothetical protein
MGLPRSAEGGFLLRRLYYRRKQARGVCVCVSGHGVQSAFFFTGLLVGVWRQSKGYWEISVAAGIWAGFFVFCSTGIFTPRYTTSLTGCVDHLAGRTVFLRSGYRICYVYNASLEERVRLGGWYVLLYIYIYARQRSRMCSLPRPMLHSHKGGTVGGVFARYLPITFSIGKRICLYYSTAALHQVSYLCTVMVSPTSCALTWACIVRRNPYGTAHHSALGIFQRISKLKR